MKIDFKTKSTIDSLDKLIQAKSKASSNALRDSGMLFVQRLKSNLRKNQTRGRAYKRGLTRTHYASRPGAFPNKDLGNLEGSVQLSNKRKLGSVFVVIAAKYAKSLEFGRRGMAARPFVRPTIEQTKRRIRLMVARALNA